MTSDEDRDRDKQRRIQARVPPPHLLSSLHGLMDRIWLNFLICSSFDTREFKTRELVRLFCHNSAPQRSLDMLLGHTSSFTPARPFLNLPGSSIQSQTLMLCLQMLTESGKAINYQYLRIRNSRSASPSTTSAASSSSSMSSR